ncbi:MAG: hypothetical protein IJ156_03935 [Bacteroidales bacterium]|nr:hypothetical protein [Bacteroidales bacterium]
MEKNSTEVLREIEAALSELKDKVRLLEEQVAEYQRLALEEAAAPVAEETFDEVDFTDIEIGEADDLPEAAAEPVAEPEPLIEPEPAHVPEEPAPAPVEPVPDALKEETLRMAWRLDKPGLPVKNIRSGISLYDRALFIGTLFKEDYALYDTTIGELNALSSLDEAVDYVLGHFPDWNLKSDIVYNFMMAVRKKLG